MDLRLHLLETFTAKGSDGASYKVCAYERMTPDVSLPHDGERWEPTGITEYRLADGRIVQVEHDGKMRIAGSGVELVAQKEAAGSGAGR